MMSAHSKGVGNVQSGSSSVGSCIGQVSDSLAAAKVATLKPLPEMKAAEEVASFAGVDGLPGSGVACLLCKSWDVVGSWWGCSAQELK